MFREIQDATYGVYEVSCVPEGACFGLTAKLEALLLPQQVLEVYTGGLCWSLHLSYGSQPGGTIELARQRVGFDGLFMKQFEERPSHIVLDYADGSRHLYQNLGRDGVCRGGAPTPGAELGGPAEDHLSLGGGQPLLDLRVHGQEALTYDLPRRLRPGSSGCPSDTTSLRGV